MDSSWGDIFPYVAGALKLIVLGIGGYYAIKWHFDEDRRVKEAEGVVFEEPSLTKKLALMIGLPVILVLLILFVIYATNWVLDM